MNLTDHDLKQINESSLSNLTHEQLVELTLRLLSDLKEAKKQLKKNRIVQIESQIKIAIKVCQ